MSDLVRFGVLGPLEVRRAESVVAIGGHQRILLALLLANANHVVSADAITDAVWGPSQPRNAEAALFTLVSRLRSRLGSDGGSTIVTRPPGYLIEVTDEQYDALRFQQLLAASRLAGDAATAVLDLQQAEALWRGRAFAGFAELEPFLIEAQRLEELRRSAAEERFRKMIDLGNHDRAIPELEALVRSEPYRERARGLLMEALFRSQRQSDALRVYGEYRDLLIEEGLEPSAVLQRLESAILTERLPSVSAPPPARQENHRQHIGFATADDGVSIAYATLGEGPPLVKTANWLTHLEAERDSLVWRHWVEGLSQNRMLIRYDERGCGLSDREVSEFSFEAYVRDLAAVVDALDLECFSLMGLSQGGPVAVAYAARHPDRVDKLVLHGTYARGRAFRSSAQQEVSDARLAAIEAGWGRGLEAFRHVFSHQFMPAGTSDQYDAFDAMQSTSTSAENALRLAESFRHIDVRQEAPNVRCPVLVTHPLRDQVAPFDEGRYLASLIPDARFLPLDSSNHLLLEGEPAWEIFLSEVRAFLEEAWG